MSKSRHSPKSNGLLILAVVLIVVGLASVAAYVFNALPVLGQADESLVFWLLPFLLFGLVSAGIGTVLAVLWLLLVSTDRDRREDERPEPQAPGRD